MIKLVAVDMDGTFLDDQMHYNRTIFRKIYNTGGITWVRYYAILKTKVYVLLSVREAAASVALTAFITEM